MRILFLQIFLSAALAQENTQPDIAQRVRNALRGSGHAGEAAAALNHRDYAAVEAFLESTHRDGEAELLAVEGAVAFLAGKYSVAIARFDQAGALSDADRFTSAMALIQLGDTQRARANLTELAQVYPNRALYEYWLGKLDYDERRYAEAVQKLQRAVELDKESARAWDSLGLAFDMQGEISEALNAFQCAVEINKRQPHPSPWPPHNLGFLLLRMERYEEAETALRESLRYPPTLAQTHYHLARTLEKQGRDRQAIDEYTTALARDPGLQEARYSLALLFRKQGREADADQMLAEYRKRKADPKLR